MPGERKFGAVMFTDIQGYSRAMSLNELGTLERLKRHHDDAIAIVERNGGRVVKTIGDALMCEFAEPAAAVRAGIAIVESSPVGAEGVQVRIGIHAGDYVVEGDDLYGETVNVAARLEPLAEPGGLALSHAVARIVRNDVPMRLIDCGERTLKNIATTVRVFRAAPLSAPRDPARLPSPRKTLALIAAAAVGVVLVAGLSLQLWLLRRAAREQPPPKPGAPLAIADTPPRRLAVVACREGGSPQDAQVGWAVASRIVEELDRYREFRPVSPSGILVARSVVLPDVTLLPDAIGAVRLANHVRADTVAAIYPSATEPGALELGLQVFDTADPSQGVTLPRERLGVGALDGVAPAELAAKIVQALCRQWQVGSLTDVYAGAGSRTTPFDAFRTYVEANELLVLGRWDQCEQKLSAALRTDPQSPLFNMMSGCALSYQGKNAEALEAGKRALANAHLLTSQRDRLVMEQDYSMLEGGAALDRGDKALAAEWGRRAIRLDTELAEVYGEPLGYLYAAASHQWLCGEVEPARAMYARARALSPWWYPAYYEDAKLVIGDGTNPAGKAEAGRLVWAFVECHPSSPLVAFAKSDIQRWQLERPGSLPPCATPAPPALRAPQLVSFTALPAPASQTAAPAPSPPAKKP